MSPFGDHPNRAPAAPRKESTARDRQTTANADGSRVSWQTLEDRIRAAAPTGVPRLLVGEGTEARGRPKSQRRAAGAGPAGARNGYGKPRPLARSNGTSTAVSGTTLRAAAQSVRRLNAPERWTAVAEGAVSVAGARVKKGTKRVPA